MLYLLSRCVAEGLGRAGQPAQGVAVVDDALGISEGHEERRCVAELLRVKGALVLLEGATDAATTAGNYSAKPSTASADRAPCPGSCKLLPASGACGATSVGRNKHTSFSRPPTIASPKGSRRPISKRRRHSWTITTATGHQAHKNGCMTQPFDDRGKPPPARPTRLAAFASQFVTRFSTDGRTMRPILSFSSWPTTIR